jgi:hypothetical protein
MPLLYLKFAGLVMRMANTFPVWIDACQFTPINQESSVPFLFPSMFELLLMQNLTLEQSLH